LRNSAKWQILCLAENLSSGRKPTNGRKSTNCQKAHKWQKLSQMAETLLLAASLPHVRKSPNWPKTHHLAEHLPNGRTSTIWQNTCQTAEHPPCSRLHSIMFYTMIISSCYAVSFDYNIAKALMFQEIHQSTLVLLCSRSLANSLVLFVLE